MPDGTIQPIEFSSGESEGPQPFRVERRDGCTDLTGPGVEKLFPGVARWAAQASSNYSVVEGGHRLCEGPTPLSGAVFSVFFVAGFPTELPSISVVESDGQWYVSPIGTMGASLVEVFRSVPDGANLIDTPLAPFFFGGMNRQSIDSSLAGVNNIPPVCAAVLAIGADGVAAVVPDPPVSEIGACVDALFEFGVASSSGTFTSAPVGVDEGVPASTAPPPPTSVEGAGG